MEELQPKETAVNTNETLQKNLDKKTLRHLRIVGWGALGLTFVAGVFTGRKTLTKTPTV